MKIKRYFAPDIRQAMRMVREEQGPDAVILSNRNVDGGVEIVAARDFLDDEAEVRIPAETPKAAGRPLEVADQDVESEQMRDARRRARQAFDDLLLKNAGNPPPEKQQVSWGLDERDGVRPAEFASVEVRASTPAGQQFRPEKMVSQVEAPKVQDTGSFASLQEEIRQMRRTLDQRLTEMAWKQGEQALPTRMDILRYLGDRGFSRAVCLELADRLGVLEVQEHALQAARDWIARALPVVEDTLLDYGGVIALVGPTGVGKTTTIAKLAARFRMRHGSRQIALVSVDSFRIAAHEQLHTYGRLLDVPVRTAGSPEELKQVLSSLYDRRLVLIDTAGMGPKDERILEQFSLLKESGVPLKTYLVLSAATQLSSLRESMRAFSAFAPGACIWTKLDEVSQLGAAISAMIEHSLPLAYYCNGQQVPEDLHRARVADLLEKCFSSVVPDNGPHEENRISSLADWMAQSNG
ncbi:MAG: hypothetical protein RIQ52_1326 [Pseudomonadota bacterium]|jgi:flagellar biosynthesis protein FlhF